MERPGRLRSLRTEKSKEASSHGPKNKKQYPYILEQDLEAYRGAAIEVGESDARIITSDQILIDERVRAKCLIPACSSLGKNAHCPPHAPDLDFMRKVVAKYQNAVFYMLKAPSTHSAGPEFKACKLGMKPAMQNWKICPTVESKAF